jgi:hypothetical protein
VPIDPFDNGPKDPFAKSNAAEAASPVTTRPVAIPIRTGRRWVLTVSMIAKPARTALSGCASSAFGQPK